ncbi:MAG: DUF1566 domain-containing protein [Bacteroidetes bacterium]|nr:DUF1566 domain-containing protein [Bacteroidota bacterium]
MKVKITFAAILSFVNAALFINCQLSINKCFSQGVAINTTGATYDNSAILDVSCSGTMSTGPTGSRQGVLIPRISLNSNTDIGGFHTPLATSLLVYNDGISGLAPAGYYYWNGAQWTQIGVTGATGATGPASTVAGPTGATGGYSVHTIGENYGGGIVFYVYDNGQHGLISATADHSSVIRWNGGSFTNTCAKGDGVGAGLLNTAIIIANQGPVDGNTFAARVCNEYTATVSGVTYGDWYLPSKFELNLLYTQKTAVNGFVNDYYWSSTENTNTSAWDQNFNGGYQNQWGGKDGQTYVRCIRNF